MTLTLNTTQQTRAYRFGLQKLDLVTLTQGSDVVRVASHGCRYDGDVYEPWLVRIEPSRQALNHIREFATLRQTLTVDLLNVVRTGTERVYAWLESELGSLEGAALVWEQLYLEDRMAIAFVDADALGAASGEAVRRYEGIVRQVGPIQDTITLQAELELPQYTWPTARNADTDPRDFGRRIPHVIGSAEQVQACNTTVGGRTTLLQDISSSEDGEVQVTSTATFPQSGTFTILIGGEQITGCEVDDATTIDLGTRATGLTNSKHLAGTQIDEVVSEAVFTLSDGACQVDALYAVNSLGNRVRFNLGTINSADTSELSGESVTTLTLDDDELVQLADLISQRVADPNEPTVTTRNESYSSDAAVTGATDANQEVIVASDRIQYDGNNGTTEKARLTWPSSLTTPTDVVNRWRIRASGTCGSQVGDNLYLWIDPSSGLQTLGASSRYTKWLGNGVPGGTAWSWDSGWITPPGGTDVADFQSETIDLQLDSDSGSQLQPNDTLDYDVVIIDLEVLPATADNPVATNGFGFTILSDLTRIDVAHPIDVLEYWIETVGGGTLDGAAKAEAQAVYDSNAVLAGDLRTAGVVWDEVLARIAYEAGINVVPRFTTSGIRWALLAPQESTQGWLYAAPGDTVYGLDDGTGWATSANLTVSTETSNIREGTGAVKVKLPDPTDAFDFAGTASSWSSVAGLDSACSIADATDSDFPGGSNNVIEITPDSNLTAGDQFAAEITGLTAANVNSSVCLLDLKITVSGSADPADVKLKSFYLIDGTTANSYRLDDVQVATTARSGDPAGTGRVGDGIATTVSVGLVYTLGSWIGGWTALAGNPDETAMDGVRLLFEVAGDVDSTELAIRVAKVREAWAVNVLETSACLVRIIRDSGDSDVQGLDLTSISRVAVKTDLPGEGNLGAVWVWGTENVGYTAGPSATPPASAAQIQRFGRLYPDGHPQGEWFDVIFTETGGSLTADSITGLGVFAALGDSTWGTIGSGTKGLAYRWTGPLWGTTDVATIWYDWIREPGTPEALTLWAPNGLVEQGRDTESELATRWSVLYAPDYQLGTGEEAYTQGLIATPDQVDVDGVTTTELDTLEDEIGVVVAEPLVFNLIRDEDTAKARAGYEISERIRRARLFTIDGAPWIETAALEPGDLRRVTPPWSGAARDCRVLAVELDPSTEQRRISLLEVTT